MKTWQKLRENPDLMKTYLMRETVIDAIRAFFKGQGFNEVETPLMVRAPGMEPYLEVFETELMDHDGAKHRAFLTTSPEYAMKKLLVAGLPKIFQICKSFRNGEDLRSSTHNPEFTILEWYRANASYFDIMADCEEMLRYIYDYRSSHSEPFQPKDDTREESLTTNVFLERDPSLASQSEAVQDDGQADRWLEYQGKRVNLSEPWERITVAESFEKFAGVDVETMLDEVKLKEVGKKKGYEVEASTWEQVYNQIFLNEIEPHLGVDQPTILYEYPALQAALSRKKVEDPRFAERFEFYIFGKEIGNAFGELTDGDEQEKRLKMEYQERKSLGKKMYELDQDFIDALKVGMPEAGGIAVGVDRLVMLFANATTLQETMWFPAVEFF